MSNGFSFNFCFQDYITLIKVLIKNYRYHYFHYHHRF